MNAASKIMTENLDIKIFISLVVTILTWKTFAFATCIQWHEFKGI